MAKSLQYIFMNFKIQIYRQKLSDGVERAKGECGKYTKAVLIGSAITGTSSGFPSIYRYTQVHFDI